MPDVYEALRRGVINGGVWDLSTLRHWKFAEVIKYVTSTWRFGTGITFYLVMNKKKWEALTPEMQKVLTLVAFDTNEKQALLWNEMDIEGRDVFKSAGGQMISLPENEA